MGKLSDLPLLYRLFMKLYPWRRRGPVPWTPLRKPLRACRLALITSSGLVFGNQTPFDESIRGGDCSFREIPSDIDTTDLIETHRSKIFDHSGIQQDPNLAFPINRMRECEEKGRIGSLNHRQLSFMGSITARERLIKESIPAASKLLVEDRVDVALLIPVWPTCNQTVGLIATALEREGISTVAIQLLREIAEKVRPPRALVVPFRHGFPLDTPDDPAKQHAVIEAAFKMLENPNLKPPAIVDYVPT